METLEHELDGRSEPGRRVAPRELRGRVPQARDLVEKVGRANVGVTYDPGNWE